MTNIKKTALTLSAIVLLAANSFAGTVNKPANNVVVDPSSEKLTVNFIGEEKGYLLFQVSVNKGANKNASLSINDKNDGELYSANLKDNKTQTFKIEKKENQEIEFSLTAGKKNYSESFTIVPTISLEKR